MLQARSRSGAGAETTLAPHAQPWLDQPAQILLAAIVALGLLRAGLAASIGLTDDEAYYRLWALAPAWGYLDHPPMAGWMIAAGRWIAGDSPFGIRLCAVLVSLLGPLVLWRSAHILFSAGIARRAVWVALAMPLMAVGGIIITPDTPSVLFWGLAAWALAELQVSRNANWWLAVGVFAGLGLLSKYTNLFVGAGILLWLAWAGNWRWLKSWQLWAGGALAALLATPVVLWNAQHEWASFAKQFGRAGRGQGWTLTYLAELIGAFAGLASPLIAVLGIAGLVRAVSMAVRERSPAHILLVSGLLPLLAYFLVHALHSRVQPNWLAPLYPTFAICAAMALAPDAGAWLRRIAAWAVPVGFVCSALLYAHAFSPLHIAAYSKDPSAQMRGWPELAAEVEAMRRARGACWIATSSYATTGQLAYHLRGRAPVVQLDESLRYVHLPPLPAETRTCPALYVELERRQERDLLDAQFASVTDLGAMDRKNAGVPLARYAVRLLAEPRTAGMGARPLR
jgi:4-amino-4-deoxy-L-arabinose transferase-like glycosyltransferase